MKRIFSGVKLPLIAVVILVMNIRFISTVSAQNYEDEIVVAEIGTTLDVGQSDKIQLNGGNGSWYVYDPSIVSIDNYGFRTVFSSYGSFSGAYVEFTGLKAGRTTLSLIGSSGRVLFSEEITVRHVPVITTETEEVEHTFIDFETKYIEDADLKKGTEEVRVAGQKGYSVTTYIYTYEDGILINTETNTVIFDPITEVIAKGTREPIVTTQTEEVEHTFIDFETRYIEDDDLKKGTEEVRQEGQKGYSVTTYTYTYEDDVLINTETNTAIVDPITEVIAKGTYEPVITTETEEEKHTFIDFETKYIEDADLEKGTEEVRIAGQKGYSVTSYTYTYEDGVLVNTEEDTIVIDPIAEIIAKGTYESPESQFGWVLKDTGWYYYSDEGTVETGWNKIKGIWYYMNSSGHMQTGWQKLGNNWFYMNSSGAMQTGWTKVGSTWYYMNSSGHMQTGWQKLGNNWFYMNGSGHMQTGWTKVNNTWYYMNSSGHMQTGWQKLNGNWFYMNSSGRMQTGWTKINNTWYYMNSSGHMQTRNQTINGKWYRFDSSGRMI